eukprot:3049915-Pleurochrysis_carterae.AAC.4
MDEAFRCCSVTNGSQAALSPTLRQTRPSTAGRASAWLRSCALMCAPTARAATCARPAARTSDPSCPTRAATGGAWTSRASQATRRTAKSTTSSRLTRRAARTAARAAEHRAASNFKACSPRRCPTAVFPRPGISLVHDIFSVVLLKSWKMGASSVRTLPSGPRRLAEGWDAQHERRRTANMPFAHIRSEPAARNYSDTLQTASCRTYERAAYRGLAMTHVRRIATIGSACNSVPGVDMLKVHGMKSTKQVHSREHSNLATATAWPAADVDFCYDDVVRVIYSRPLSNTQAKTKWRKQSQHRRRVHKGRIIFALGKWAMARQMKVCY